MLKGKAIIIRNEDERQCFIGMANKLYLRGNSGSTPERLTSFCMPVLVVCSNKESTNCMTYTSNIYYDTIQPKFEASDLFRNQLISMRRKRNVT